MAKRAQAKSASLDFSFFRFLWEFHRSNRGAIRRTYKELTRKFLDFNDPDRNSKAFLRQPQFEALEIYVFLKEFLDNAKVEDIFQDWYKKQGKFLERAEGGRVGHEGSGQLFDFVTGEQYQGVFAAMRRNSRAYPNYIFALTMGTGKTLLMATCIFYEFLLGNKFSKDTRYCHNALIFAPDRTVLQTIIADIEAFDFSKVVPPEYVNFLTTHLRLHYLEEAGTALSLLDRSRFNIIVSNTQKIILKRQHKDKSPLDQLFSGAADLVPAEGVYAEAADLYESDQPEDEAELTTNQRFEKLCRLEQLGIYVDEAHHVFGSSLAKDMGIGTSENDTSLRTTIDRLAGKLEKAGTRVVACYNYTGTPYVGRTVLPEVVYAYGLKEAIDKGFLKKVVLHGYSDPRTDEFIELAVQCFLTETKDIRPEGMLPKIAFFGATIEEVTEELKPAVERALSKYGIPSSRILVNVGDSSATTNDDLREFRQLDTPASEKQFILLVNKGREGWNCRSLFSVGLFRKPKSKVFVLQATMRCLRSIGEAQHTGHVFLSNDNLEILNDELQQNFQITAEELQETGKDKETVTVRVVEPLVKIKLVRVRKRYTMQEKSLIPGQALLPERGVKPTWSALVEKYRLIETQQQGLTSTQAALAKTSQTFDLTEWREKREFSPLTLVAEISRYMNRDPLALEELLEETAETVSGLVEIANEFNELLYDEIIPRLFKALYKLDENEQTEEHEVELIKVPPSGYYQVTAPKDKIVRIGDVNEDERSKSFHLDTYCFDSNPESQLFWDLLRESRVKKIYFTGMLTHGQSDFFIQYIDPETHAVRSYYPDFLFLRTEADGTEKYVIVEVKADNQIDDSVVLAKKEFAEQLAVASGMEYRLIKATDASQRKYRQLM